MLCENCNKNLKKNTCLITNKPICSKCCENNKNICDCSIYCKNLYLNSSDNFHVPIQAKVFEEDGDIYNSITQVFLPNAYRCIEMEITKFDLIYHDVQNLNLNFILKRIRHNFVSSYFVFF